MKFRKIRFSKLQIFKMQSVTSGYRYKRTALLCIITQRVMLIFSDVSISSSGYKDSRTWTLKMGLIGCPEMSIRNCQPSPRYNPEKRYYFQNVSFKRKVLRSLLPSVCLSVSLKRKMRWKWFNLLAPELFFFLILVQPVYRMLIQEPNALELWNKLHFEEKKTDSIYNV